MLGVATAFLMSAAVESLLGLDEIALLGAKGALAGIAVMLAILGLFALLRRFKVPLAEDFRAGIVPARWPAMEEALPAVPAMDSRDIARRWFVAVAAVTGIVVFSLAATDAFESGLRRTFSPGSIFAVAVVAIASAILEGPMRDFVFRQGAAEKPVSGLSFDDMTLRSWIRLALVGAFFLALALLFNSLEESVSQASFDAAMIIVFAGLPPAIVSYYWSAALQTQPTGTAVRKAATRASFDAGTALYYPYGIVLTAVFGLLMLRGAGLAQSTGLYLMVVLSPLLGVFPAMAMSWLLFALPAMTGAWVLERFSGWASMAVLAIALAVVSYVPLVALILVFYLLGDPPERFPVLYLAFGAAGWVVGLLAAGFPQLVQRARQQGAPVTP